MSYTLLDETRPKARKEHQCIWCGEKILIGETYRREKSVYDGNMQDHKWHLECNLDAQEYFRKYGDEDFDAGQAERPKEHLGFNPPTP